MKTKPYEIHEAAKIMPPMSDAEYRALKDDIEANGLKNPVAMLDGELLDGIHRMQACIDLGMTLRTVDVKLNGQTPAEYVFSQNYHRRHLTESQRGMVAAKMRKLAKNAGNNGESANLHSLETAAEAVNVSRRTVASATKVVVDGSVALQDAVEASEVPVSVAAKLTELPKSEQTAAVKAGPKGIKKAVAKVEKKKTGKPTKDLRKFAELKETFGKAVRVNTAIKEQCGGTEHHEAIRVHINAALKVLETWRKESGAA